MLRRQKTRAALILLFFLVSILSFYQLEQSISVVKYLLGHTTRDLLNNYDLYHRSFLDFASRTIALGHGNTADGWRSFFYLTPLFVFSDLSGGLTLKTLYAFSIINTLFFLVIFYQWIKMSWGRGAAFFAVFFLGSSSVFQEIARSGTYHSFSVLMLMLWAWFCFSRIGSERAPYFGILGMLTGFLCYMYSLVRGVILVAFLRVFWMGGKSRRAARGLFLLTFILAILPGIWGLWEYHRHPADGPWYGGFIDPENILDVQRVYGRRILSMLSENMLLLKDRLLGAPQILDWPMHWKVHAPFLNRLLVLPLFLGIYLTVRSLGKVRYGLLLGLALMIYLLPVLTSAGGWNEPRRAVFYVIPTYCFIGIGSQQIFRWICSIKNSAGKIMVSFVAACVVFIVLIAEISFFQKHIISGKRDLGILALVQKVKEKAICGRLYYLQHRSMYNGATESEIMTLALLERGGSCIDLRAASLQSRISGPGGFFLVRSPDIADVDFKDWVSQQGIRTRLIFESALTNLRPGRPFMVYESSLDMP